MLYPVIASVIGWSAILFGVRFGVSHWQPPVWARRMISATGVTVAVLWVLAVGLYSELHELLSETSVLWTVW